MFRVRGSRALVLGGLGAFYRQREFVSVRLTPGFLHARHEGTPHSPARAEATCAKPRGSPPHAHLRVLLPLSPLRSLLSGTLWNVVEYPEFPKC